MEVQTNPGRNLYVASFTYTDTEAVHYWAVYGKRDPFSIRIAIDRNSIFRNSNIFTDEINNPVLITNSKLSDVIYYRKRDPKSKDQRCWKHNLNFFSLLDDEITIRNRFVGLCKYDIWEHEKETRLLVESNFELNSIYLKLPDEFFISMRIVFSPWIEETIREELSRLLQITIEEKYGIKKPKYQMRQSSIYNQIKI